MLFNAVFVFLKEGDCGVPLFEVSYWISIDDFAEVVNALKFLQLFVQRFKLTVVGNVHQFLELLKFPIFTFTLICRPFRLTPTVFLIDKSWKTFSHFRRTSRYWWFTDGNVWLA
jgi:hypothetical protein